MGSVRCDGVIVDVDGIQEEAEGAFDCVQPSDGYVTVSRMTPRRVK